MDSANENKQLRSFGFIVGGVFLIIGLWPLWRGESYRTWAVVFAGLLITPAMLAPALLRHPNALWMRIAHVLGWLNTKVVLTMIFFVVFTPVAAVLRLIGKDPLNRSFDDAESYRVLRPTRDRSHLKHQF